MLMMKMATPDSASPTAWLPANTNHASGRLWHLPTNDVLRRRAYAPRDFNPVAPCALCGVESRICLDDQAIEVRGVCPFEARNAEARRHRETASIEIKFRCLKIRADAFDYDPRVLLSCMRQNKKKLLSAYAAADVAPPGIGPKYFRESLQHSVACIMPVRVIDGLEMIQVCHDHEERKPIPGGPAQLPGCPVFNRSTVGQSG